MLPVEVCITIKHLFYSNQANALLKSDTDLYKEWGIVSRCLMMTPVGLHHTQRDEAEGACCFILWLEVCTGRKLDEGGRSDRERAERGGGGMAENRRLDVVTFIETKLSPLWYGNWKRREEKGPREVGKEGGERGGGGVGGFARESDPMKDEE